MVVGGVQVRRAGSEDYIIVPCLSGIATRREGKGSFGQPRLPWPGLACPYPIGRPDTS